MSSGFTHYSSVQPIKS